MSSFIRPRLLPRSVLNHTVELQLVCRYHASAVSNVCKMTSPHDRLTACWGIQNCERCIKDNHGCGWCPSSLSCIPASSLLEPITNKYICPLENERFELRTRVLGCGCSTTTLLSIIVTIFATIAALLVLSIIGRVIRQLNRTFGSGGWRGIEIKVESDGTRRQREWRRGSWFTRLKWNLRGGNLNPNRSEQEQITERSRLLG